MVLLAAILDRHVQEEKKQGERSFRVAASPWRPGMCMVVVVFAVCYCEFEWRDGRVSCRWGNEGQDVCGRGNSMASVLYLLCALCLHLLGIDRLNTLRCMCSAKEVL